MQVRLLNHLIMHDLVLLFIQHEGTEQVRPEQHQAVILPHVGQGVHVFSVPTELVQVGTFPLLVLFMIRKTKSVPFDRGRNLYFPICQLIYVIVKPAGVKDVVA